MHQAHGKLAEVVASLLPVEGSALMLYMERSMAKAGLANLASIVRTAMAYFKGNAQILFSTPCAFVGEPAMVLHLAREHPSAYIVLNRSMALPVAKVIHSKPRARCYRWKDIT
jgi:hypothetical protein